MAFLPTSTTLSPFMLLSRESHSQTSRLHSSFPQHRWQHPTSRQGHTSSGRPRLPLLLKVYSKDKIPSPISIFTEWATDKAHLLCEHVINYASSMKQTAPTIPGYRDNWQGYWPCFALRRLVHTYELKFPEGISAPSLDWLGKIQGRSIHVFMNYTQHWQRQHTERKHQTRLTRATTSAANGEQGVIWT